MKIAAISDRVAFDRSLTRALGTRVDGSTFVEAFYRRFLATSPEIAAMFLGTDFDKQRLVLVASIRHVVSFDPAGDADPVMEELAVRHQELGVGPHLYATWLACLLDALSSHDPEYDRDVEAVWKRALGPGIEFMVNRCFERG